MDHELLIHLCQPIEGNVHPDFTEGSLCCGLDLTSFWFWTRPTKQVPIATLWAAIEHGAREAIAKDAREFADV